MHQKSFSHFLWNNANMAENRSNNETIHANGLNRRELLDEEVGFVKLVLQRIVVPVVTGYRDISDLDLKNDAIDQQVKYIEQASKFSPEGSREEHKKHVTACYERKKSSDNVLEKQKETTVRYTQDYDKADIARRQAEASVEKLDKFRKEKMRDLQQKHRRELEDLEQRQEY